MLQPVALTMIDGVDCSVYADGEKHALATQIIKLIDRLKAVREPRSAKEPAKVGIMDADIRCGDKVTGE